MMMAEHLWFKGPTYIQQVNGSNVGLLINVLTVFQPELSKTSVLLFIQNCGVLNASCQNSETGPVKRLGKLQQPRKKFPFFLITYLGCMVDDYGYCCKQKGRENRHTIEVLTFRWLKPHHFMSHHHMYHLLSPQEPIFQVLKKKDITLQFYSKVDEINTNFHYLCTGQQRNRNVSPACSIREVGPPWQSWSSATQKYTVRCLCMHPAVVGIYILRCTDPPTLKFQPKKK